MDLTAWILNKHNVDRINGLQEQLLNNAKNYAEFGLVIANGDIAIRLTTLPDDTTTTPGTPIPMGKVEIKKDSYIADDSGWFPTANNIGYRKFNQGDIIGFHTVTFKRQSGINWLVYEKSTAKFKLLNYRDVGEMPTSTIADFILLASWVGTTIANVASATTLTVDGVKDGYKMSLKSLNDDSVRIAFHEKIKVDYDKNTITFPEMIVIDRYMSGGTWKRIKASDFLKDDGTTPETWTYTIRTDTYYHTMYYFDYDLYKAGKNPIVEAVGAKPPANDGRNVDILQVVTPTGGLSPLALSKYPMSEVKNLTDYKRQVIRFVPSGSGKLTVDFNFTDGKIYIPHGYLVVDKLYDYYIITNSNPGNPTSKSGYQLELNLPTAPSAGINALYFKPSTKKFEVVAYTSTVANRIETSYDAILLGTWYGENAGTINTIFNHTVNGATPRGEKKEVGIFIPTNQDYIDINFIDKKVYLPSGYVMNESNANGHWNPKWADMPTSKSGYAGEVPFSTKTSGINALYYAPSTSKFIVANYQDSAVPTDAIMLAGWYNTGPSLYSLTPMKVNGVLQAGGESSFNKGTHRLILPPEMFIVKGKGLPVYKSSVISYPDGLQGMRLSAKYYQGNIPRIKSFEEDFFLDDSLPSLIRFFLKQTANHNEFFYQDVKLNVVDPATATNKTPKLILIGDSLTNRSQPFRVKQLLGTMGITATMYGTMANTGGESGEGREGWEFENYVGRDNTRSNGGSVITIQTTGGKDSSDLNKNPFLKLATASDKTNFPDWCFRNTGAEREKSYTEDTDKTGNFYIFDFRNYLTMTGFPDPDVVTIALSTNDITQNGAVDGVAHSLEALEIMVKQIKTAVPNVKIGVITPAWASNSSGNSYWQGAVADWIERYMTLIRTMALTNVYPVSVWAHMSRDQAFPLVANDLSAQNVSKVATLSDYIHYSTDGEYMYADANSQFIANMCK